MNTLKTLRLHNFQCHRDLTIELGGVTALVGDSDHGKSVVVRALYWLAFNEPAGIDYRTHGEKDTCVEATLWNGVTVSRFRSNSTNGYMLDVPGKDTVKWDKVGRAVPPEVSEALGLKVINFQLQHDPHFLISLRPAEAGRAVNELVDLSAIDRSLKALTSGLRETKGDVDRYKLQLELKQLEASDLDALDLPARAAQLNMLVTVRAQIKCRAAAMANLEEYIKLDSEDDDWYEVVETMLKPGEALLLEALKHRQDHVVSAAKITRLQELGSSIAAAAKAAAGAATLAAAAKVLSDIQEMSRRTESTRRRIERLNSLTQDIRTSSLAVQTALDEAEAMEVELPQACPTCGQPIGDRSCHAVAVQ